ncbi:MAG: hypothetical protein LBV03_09490 [Fusobacteriales bacterium]|nr:hypothetical protein [Fusobacteriales bacterium]
MGAYNKTAGEKQSYEKVENISMEDKEEEFPSYEYLKALWLEGTFAKKKKKHTYSAEELEALYRHVKNSYKAVTLLLMKKEAGVSAVVIRKHFGTWNKFLIHMGEEPNRIRTKVLHTNDELIELYKGFSRKIGKIENGATLRDLKNYGFPYSKSVISNRFTSINNLRKLSGFNITKEVIPKYNKQGLIIMLYKNYKKYGRKLSQTEIDKEETLPSPSTIFYYFQTTKITEVWNEVLNSR